MTRQAEEGRARRLSVAKEFHANYSSICLLHDGHNIEAGIPPDIKVDITDDDRIDHIDTIIETAIDEF